METHVLKEKWIDDDQFVVVENVTEEPPRMIEICSDCTTGEAEEASSLVDNNDCSEDDAKKQDEPHHDPQTVGAGVATGLCGLLIGGPLLGICLGLGAGYAAENDTKSPVGNTARKIGDLALQTEGEAAKLNRKYNVSNHINNWANHVWTFTMETWSSISDCSMDIWNNLRDNCASAQTVEGS